MNSKLTRDEVKYGSCHLEMLDLNNDVKHSRNPHEIGYSHTEDKENICSNVIKADNSNSHDSYKDDFYKMNKNK
jgi:hypothetical protein